MPSLSQGQDSRRSIRNEIKAARSAREKKAKFWRKFNKELRGRQYDNDGSPKRITNYPYLYMTTFLPELAGREPDFSVTARMQFTDAARAEAMRLCLGTIMRQQKFIDELRLCVIDGLYAFMFGKTGMCEQESGSPQGSDSGGYYGAEPFLRPTMPFFERISPFYAIWDDSAQDFKRCAYVGHEFTRDTDSVRLDDRYDSTVRARITGDGWSHADDFDRERYASFSDEIPSFQKMIEVYVAPTRTLYTLLETSKDEFYVLRKVPYYGPANGPYHMRGFTPASDRVVPVSPAHGWWDGYAELELNEQKMNESAQAEKRVATCATSDAEGAKRYKNAKSDDLVLGVPDIKEVHTGGVTKERLIYTDRAKNQVENLSAVASVRRENIAGDSTATAASIVDQSANNRVNDQRRSVVEFSKEVGEDFKWYIHENQSISVRATMTSPIGLPADVLIQGGPEVDPASGMPLPDQTTPDDFEVDLDARSLYMDNAAMMRQKAVADAGFILGPYSQFLGAQGATVNMMAFSRWFAQRAQIPELMGWIVPMSPVAQQMMMLAQQQGPKLDQVLAGMGGPSQQSQIQNSPMTNGANSMAGQMASPMRQAQTMPGANNAETSF